MITLTEWSPYTERGTLKRTALIRCTSSTCRKHIVLSNYEIDDTGIVSPPVNCHHCNANIGKLRLSGWPFDIDLLS